MKTLHNWHTRQLDYRDERSQGYYNPPMILHYKENEVVISSGVSDDTKLFEHEGYIVLLSTNSSLDYAGITVYDEKLIELSEVFIQSVNDGLSSVHIPGKDFFDYAYWYQAKLLYLLVGDD